MFTSPKPNEIKDWTCILESTHEFEVNLSHNFLKDYDIPSQILSKRDTAYSLEVHDNPQSPSYPALSYLSPANANYLDLCLVKYQHHHYVQNGLRSI